MLSTGFQGFGGYCRPTKRNPGLSLDSGFYLDELQAGPIDTIVFKDSANCPQLVDATETDLPMSVAQVGTGSPQALSCPYGELRLLSPSLVTRRLF